MDDLRDALAKYNEEIAQRCKQEAQNAAEFAALYEARADAIRGGAPLEES